MFRQICLSDIAFGTVVFTPTLGNSLSTARLDLTTADTAATSPRSRRASSNRHTARSTSSGGNGGGGGGGGGGDGRSGVEDERRQGAGRGGSEDELASSKPLLQVIVTRMAALEEAARLYPETVVCGVANAPTMACLKDFCKRFATINFDRNVESERVYTAAAGLGPPGAASPASCPGTTPFAALLDDNCLRFLRCSSRNG